MGLKDLKCKIILIRDEKDTVISLHGGVSLAASPLEEFSGHPRLRQNLSGPRERVNLRYLFHFQINIELI
jgi:hypothetical protein